MLAEQSRGEESLKIALPFLPFSVVLLLFFFWSLIVAGRGYCCGNEHSGHCFLEALIAVCTKTRRGDGSGGGGGGGAGAGGERGVLRFFV